MGSISEEGKGVINILKRIIRQLEEHLLLEWKLQLVLQLIKQLGVIIIPNVCSPLTCCGCPAETDRQLPT